MIKEKIKKEPQRIQTDKDKVVDVHSLDMPEPQEEIGSKIAGILINYIANTF